MIIENDLIDSAFSDTVYGAQMPRSLIPAALEIVVFRFDGFTPVKMCHPRYSVSVHISVVILTPRMKLSVKASFSTVEISGFEPLTS